jgi:hypothetical protein
MSGVFLDSIVAIFDEVHADTSTNLLGKFWTDLENE